MKRSFSLDRSSLTQIALFLAPILVFTLHSITFGTWIVDDAAISFAYSHNLAFGHGLVAQPGAVPVEGYSNPLWVLLLAPFFRLGFDPVFMPKLIAWVLVVAAYYLLYRTLRYRAVVALALVALSLNTSFVAWCISGLENPLYVFNAALLLWALVRRRFGLAGFAVALMATTRPDGLAYLLVLPLLGIINRWSLRDAVRFVLALGVPYAAFIALRYAMFGALLPNTAVVKSGFDPISIRFLSVIFGAGGGIGGVLLLVLLPVLVLVILWRHKLSEEIRCLLACLLIALLVFNVLPPDWMGEYRFGTLFFLFLYPAMALVFETLLPRAASVLMLLVIVGNAVLFLPRTQIFALKPTVPFADVSRLSVALTAYADQLGVSEPSVLSPDAGGILYDDTLTFIDMAGLTDTVIARSLYANAANPDFERFYRYVLDEKRPTFIEYHGIWLDATRLPDAPEFARDYALVLQCSSTALPGDTDAQYNGWLYVRRDALTAMPDAEMSDAMGKVVGHVSPEREYAVCETVQE